MRRHTGWVRVVVTEVTGAGSIRRGVLDTAGQSDPGRCVDLIERAALGLPPPYRPVPGRPVYQVRAGESMVFVADRELVGPLRELVMTALALGRADADPGGIAPAQQQDEPGSRPPGGRPVPAHHRIGLDAASPGSSLSRFLHKEDRGRVNRLQTSQTRPAPAPRSAS
jgi:hypothetical protein